MPDGDTAPASDVDSWQITAVRLAANHCPPDRSRAEHENAVWNNFCDRFARRSDFDRQLLNYVQSKRRKVI